MLQDWPVKHRRIFYAGIGLAALNWLYFLFWVVLDVTARAGWLTGEIFGFDPVAFVASVPLAHEVPFAMGFIAKSIALWGLWRRRKWAVLLFAAGYLLSVFDWVLLASNPYFDDSVSGYAMLIMNAAIFGLFGLLWFEKRLR